MSKNYIILFLFLIFRVSAQEIPIMAFHGVSKDNISEQSFKNLKDAGFTINFTVFDTNEQVQKALDCAQLVGVKLLIYSSELHHNTEATINRFKNHPALFGYYIQDEPPVSQFNNVQQKISEIKKYDSIHPCYVNLFPNYADNKYLGTNSYREYLDKFVRTVPVDFLSFDHYPIKNTNIVNKEWYANLEEIRNTSLMHKKNFWGFANSTVFWEYKQPTENGLRLQQFSNLLYGAKGLQYFTYWTLDNEYWRKNNFGHSIVDAKGNPTITYSLVKSVNKEIRYWIKYFYNSKISRIYHSDFEMGTNLLPDKPLFFNKFRINGSGLISYFDSGNKKYVAVLNKSMKERLELNLNSNRNINIDENKNSMKIIKANHNILISVEPSKLIIFSIQ